MKLQSFLCQFDEAAVKVAVVSHAQMSIIFRNVHWREFKPDFVNEKMNQFVFWTDTDNWRNLEALYHKDSGFEFILEETETPKDFDIYYFFHCNESVIEYILHPIQRNLLFLHRNSEAVSSDYVKKQIYKQISTTHQFSFNSVYKLKMLCRSLEGDHNMPGFLSRTDYLLKKLSKWFPKLYVWIYDNLIFNSKFLPRGFDVVAFKCSEALVARFYDNDDADELPF